MPLLAVLLLSSCVPYKSLVNYNEGSRTFDKPQPIANYSPLTIQPSDILQIEVGSIEEKAVEMFKNYQAGGYMVNPDGSIDFPLLGKVNLEGKTTAEASENLLSELKKYFVDPPIVNVRIVNFNVSVNGEVNGPGNFKVGDERISIVEAITLAGDFTPYSRRDSVLIVREENNTRVFGYVDFNRADLFNSPYFYLRQNDVVYVMPDKHKLGTIRNRETKALPFASLGVSLIILTVTILNLR